VHEGLVLEHQLRLEALASRINHEFQVMGFVTCAQMFAVRFGMITSGIAMRTRPQVRFVRLLCLRSELKLPKVQ
jgi:hypothetical protein